MVVVKGMLVASVGTLFYYMLAALDNKTMAKLMRVATIMAIISIVAPAVWGAITDFKAWIDGIVDALTFWR